MSKIDTACKSIRRVVACQSGTANLELWAWSCGFRSAGLASAVTCDRQQYCCVRPSAGERQRT